MTLMADSTTPGLIPASFRTQRNRGVAPYINGPRAWSPAQISVFPRHLKGIDVTGGAPELADVLDCERFDATPGQFPQWRTDRVAFMHAHGLTRGWPKPYTSINPGLGFGVEPIWTACERAGQEPPEHWWIAWYKLVNGEAPTQYDVAQEIERLTTIQVDPSDIWGCQYQTLPNYDLTIVYQEADWQ